MRSQSRIMHYSSILTSFLAAHVVSAAFLAPRQSLLVSCAKQSLVGSNTTARVVAPESNEYTDARLGEKIQFEQFPALIVYVTSTREVAPLMRCAQESGIKAVPRNGGHHFEAYSALSNTLVIDLSHLDYVKISSDHTSAIVGGGIRLGALYTALDAYDTTWVGGICPTVGLSGLISAGGFNMQMRALGLSSDHVESAQVIVANGTTITASQSANSDLFWAIRGGGGSTWGIVVEFTLLLSKLPRSAMLAISWNDPEIRFDVAQRFLEWGPRQPREFTSQVNVYRDSVQVLGWYLGGTRQQLQKIVQDSSLLQIGAPQFNISGNCSTDNSRVFGYTVNDCVPDEEVDASILNVVPNPFSQYDKASRFAFDETPVSLSRPAASPWPRFRRISKSFFVQKDNPLNDTVLREVVDRIGQLDDSSQVWGEWHAWNISSQGNGSDNAFAWREQALAHLEFQVHGSNDSKTQLGYEQWFDDLESYLRPAVGPASYGGYADRSISTDPLQSYFGDNICRLIEIKKQYDPTNFFTNPNAVPPTPPKGITC